MRQGLRWPSPSLVIATIALFVALGGSVYAAKKARINGRAIRVKSLPGNRLKPRSVPGNRLKPRSVPGNRLKPRSITANRLAPGLLASIPSAATGSPGVITGLEVDELTLDQVPEAAHADTADFARSATGAETALNAVNAVSASRVNGYEAGCLPGTELFASACWQTSAAATAVTAPAAAQACAAQGGELPEALQLAAYSQQATLDDRDEWSSNITAVSGADVYGVVTVSAAGVIYYSNGTSTTKKYRCVFPLLR